MRPSGIGGQAVIEGVMMKNKSKYATAVRKPNKEIEVRQDEYISLAEKYKIFKLPILRGMLAFVESMIIGTKTLTFSSSFYEDEETPSKLEVWLTKVFGEKAERIVMTITMIISIALAIAIFVVFPSFITQIMGNVISSRTILAVIEGVIRICIFIAYVLLISQMEDIKRTFMYHGAEHKTINCIERGYELTVDNVRKQSRQHKRCGTSFIFVVLFVSILFFMFIRIDTLIIKTLVRILLIPIIAGISYEFIRLAGKYDNPMINILSKPGMLLQNLTTKEPTDDMIEVAIASVEAVFDWRSFLSENDVK